MSQTFLVAVGAVLLGNNRGCLLLTVIILGIFMIFALWAPVVYKRGRIADQTAPEKIEMLPWIRTRLMMDVLMPLIYLVLWIGLFVSEQTSSGSSALCDYIP